jgi:Family of unknown function (DUF6221)
VTLTEFLLARIAEDEAAAQYALAHAIRGEDFDHQWKWIHLYRLKDRQRGWSSGHHDGAPSPARVLAECEAKRRIVRLHDELLEENLAKGDASAWGADLMHMDVLRLLAMPYADHPDYQQGWRP